MKFRLYDLYSGNEKTVECDSLAKAEKIALKESHELLIPIQTMYKARDFL